METTNETRKNEVALPLTGQPCPCGPAEGRPERCAADCSECPLTVKRRVLGAIHFETAEFEFSHGRKPRDPSYGGPSCWAFTITAPFARHGKQVFMHGKLAACKRTAKAIAREMGAFDVRIDS